jgi:xylulose-5-phosphate/fructose-6-phosphate phosphoketolase
MRSYRAEELFTSDGQATTRTARARPKGKRRMGDNPHSNGGVLLRSLRLPDFREYAVVFKKPGATNAEATRVQGAYMRDVMQLNLATANFRHLQSG